MKKISLINILLCLFITPNMMALTDEDIPASYANLKVVDGKLVAKVGDNVYPLADETPKTTLKMLRGNPIGVSKGIEFSFVDDNGNAKFVGGKLYYGLIDLEYEKFAEAKWHNEDNISSLGKATADIKTYLSGKQDFIGWEKKGSGTLSYRVCDSTGDIEFEGEIGFLGSDSFSVDSGSIVSGPYLNQLKDRSVIITFETYSPRAAKVNVEGVGDFTSPSATMHEVVIDGLQSDTLYKYTVSAGGTQTRKASFKTAPSAGSRKPFTFAYTCDSRSGSTMGERELSGVNVYTMKKFASLAAAKNVKFVQFTGDMTDGYKLAPAQQEVEYVTWKHSISQVASRIPFVVGMGNHEVVLHAFDDGVEHGLTIDKFPFDTQSGEAVFAKYFANPKAGELGGFVNPVDKDLPPTEDGAVYDPSDKTDFPSYSQNVFYYTYDNVAIVVLNSNYWYAPGNPGQHAGSNANAIGGNPHSYIMDNQLGWLKNALKTLDEDENIDFTFVTVHTPPFPNGGHVDKDMWYNGKNDARPYIGDGNGSIKPVAIGIIDRRDEFLKTMLDSKKVVGIFTGDEHNYARLDIAPNMPIYDESEYVPQNRLNISRHMWQLHSGTAGAPYAAYEETPWNDDLKDIYPKQGGKYLKKFSTQNALIFIHVDGKSLELEVVDPQTLDRIE